MPAEAKPSPAGCSGTPLAKKLGIKPGHRVSLMHPPKKHADYIEGIPDDAKIISGLRGTRQFDVIVLFVVKRKKLRDKAPKAIERLADRGGLWIAWPKKVSGVATDLSDGLVREIGLATGLVDNKVCAIDDVWSALRFVRRLKK